MVGLIRTPSFALGLAPLLAVLTSLAAAAPVLPGQDCRTPSLDSWSEAERWAWTEICEGRVSDFDRKLGGLVPKKSEGWDERREISQAFLEVILLHEPFKTAVPRQGVRFVGALFSGPIDLTSADVAHELWLDRSRFENKVTFRRATFQRLLSLESSAFEDQLLLNGMESRTVVKMGQGARYGQVELRGAKIAGQLLMSEALFAGELDMNNLTVGSDLFMRDSKSLKKVNLIGARVDGTIDFWKSRFDRELDMNSVEVGGSVFMRAGARFGKEVSLLGSGIRGNLELDDAVFQDKLNLNSIEVAGDLFMRAGHFGPVELLGARIGGQLSMAGSSFGGTLRMGRLNAAGDVMMRDGASFQDVSLIGARIAGFLALRDSDFDGHVNLSRAVLGVELQLTSPCGSGASATCSGSYPPPRWSDKARLTLRNAHAAGLNDTEAAWGLEPGRLDLVGFTYNSLGGVRSDGESAMSSRSVDWLLDWLGKQESFRSAYNPQPFEQLAKVLRQEGHEDSARDILVAARNHQRDSPSTPLLSKAWLWLQYVLIGYGYRNWTSVLWFAGLCAAGTFVLGRVSGAGPLPAWRRFWYSFDSALPVLSLDDQHRSIALSGGVLVYFYFHKMIGFVLISFLLAGLSGLTK